MFTVCVGTYRVSPYIYLCSRCEDIRVLRYEGSQSVGSRSPISVGIEVTLTTILLISYSVSLPSSCCASPVEPLVV